MGGKKKKAKKELSQAEIWDDSALLQSWDEALAEYKKYHSIHARGERVEDVIKAFEANENASNTPVNPAHAHLTSDNVASEELEDGELEDVETGDDPIVNGLPRDSGHRQSSLQPVADPPQTTHSFPDVVDNNVKDEPLKHLMMSWYYAGYYTGLYEGQKSAMDANTK